MYVNTFICLDENISGYGMNKKTPSGHVTIKTPGFIRCYIQDLDQKGKAFVLYLMSKKNNHAVRVGQINSQDKDKETRWTTDINNLFNSGIRGCDIDSAAIVIEGSTAGNTDAILTGFTGEKYLLVPLIEKALPKKEPILKQVASKEKMEKPIIEVKEEKKVEKPIIEVKEEKKIEKPIIEVKEEKKIEKPIIEVKEEKKVEKPIIEVKKEEKVKVEEPIKVKPLEVKTETMEKSSEDIKAKVADILGKEEKKQEAKEQTIVGENLLKEKIKNLLEDELKSLFNSGINNEKNEEIKKEDNKKEMNTALDSLIKAQLQKVMASDKMNKKKEPIKEEKAEEIEKIDFCEPREGCAEEEEEYLKNIDKQLRALEKRLNDTKIHIVNINKEMQKESEEVEGSSNRAIDEDQELGGLEELEQYEKIEGLEGLKELEQYEKIEGLEELEELEQYEGIEGLEELEQYERIEGLGGLEELKKYEGLGELEELEQYEGLGGLEELKQYEGLGELEELEQYEGLEGLEELEQYEELVKNQEAEEDMMEVAQKDKIIGDNIAWKIEEENDLEQSEENMIEDYLNYRRVDEIFNNSDPIYPFEAHDEDRDWVRISLSELMSIPQLSFEWCTSPCVTFCTHKYKHAILGKDKVLGQYYIGIPDKYHPDRRSMLAVDRVERFMCCRDVNPSIGEYGYWMVAI